MTEIEMDQTTQAFPPHLKKVLKSYQASAISSLQGPNSFMGVWDDKCTTVATTKPTVNEKKPAVSSTKCSDYDPFVAPPPFPIQQPPILTPADQSRCERSETTLEVETISCFIVGGEKRLCLPQILNTVLREFSLQQINSVCDDLHIYCSRCNREQLEVLKVTGILPFSAPSCGLITKTDAERLCSALLHSNPPKSNLKADDKSIFHLKVYHKCFGNCKGIFWSDLYSSPHSCCVECVECKGLFTPQKFVCHTHRAKNRTCHWGFDSSTWRCYILLSKDQDCYEQCQQHLDELKKRFDHGQRCNKRKQTVEDVSAVKHYRLEEHPYPSILWEPALAAYWYATASWARMCSVKSWPQTKEGKPMIVPNSLQPYLRESCLPVSVPSYIAHDTSFHLDADDIVSDINRHIPDSIQRISTKKESPYTVTKASATHPTLTKDTTWTPQEPENQNGATTDSDEDTLSDSTMSTLSGTEGDYESIDDEDEISTGLEDDLAELQVLLEESKMETAASKKILAIVKALVLKNRKPLCSVLKNRKLVQKELEKMCSAKKARICKLKADKKNLQIKLDKMRAEYDDRILAIDKLRQVVKVEDANAKSELKHCKRIQEYSHHSPNKGKVLSVSVPSLQKDVERNKNFVPKVEWNSEECNDSMPCS